MEDFKKISQPENSIIVFRIRCVFCVVFLSFICGIVVLFNIIVAIVLFFICSIFGVYLICFYCAKKVLNTNFYVFDSKLLIEKGVYTKKITYIEFSSIEHTSKIVLPDQRLFNLLGFLIHLQGSKVYLENLDEEKLRFITEKIKICQK